MATSLGQAYSLLGQGYSAAYQNRHEEEKKERKRARRDQLVMGLGQHIVFPVVKDLISAPFKEPIQNFFNSTEGKVFKSDLNRRQLAVSDLEAKEKRINLEYDGDGEAYYKATGRGQADSYTADHFRKNYNIDYERDKDRITASQSRAYSAFINQAYDISDERAKIEWAEHQKFKAALAGLPDADQVASVVKKYNPKSSNFGQYVYRSLKRRFGGKRFEDDEGLLTRKQMQDKELIDHMRSELGLTDEEHSAFLEASRKGLTVNYDFTDVALPYINAVREDAMRSGDPNKIGTINSILDAGAYTELGMLNQLTPLENQAVQQRTDPTKPISRAQVMSIIDENFLEVDATALKASFEADIDTRAVFEASLGSRLIGEFYEEFENKYTKGNKVNVAALHAAGPAAKDEQDLILRFKSLSDKAIEATTINFANTYAEKKQQLEISESSVEASKWIQRYYNTPNAKQRMQGDITKVARNLLSEGAHLLEEEDKGFYDVKWSQEFDRMLQQGNVWDSAQRTRDNSLEGTSYNFVAAINKKGHEGRKAILTQMVTGKTPDQLIEIDKALKRGSYTRSEIGEALPENTSRPIPGGLYDSFKIIFKNGDNDALQSVEAVFRGRDREDSDDDNPYIPNFLEFGSRPSQRESVNPFGEEDRLGKY